MIYVEHVQIASIGLELTVMFYAEFWRNLNV